jgi:predicted phage terminase large subunit-like protein
MNETPLTVPLEIQEEQAKLELRLMQLDIQGKAKNNFINFVKYVWPEAILGAHHTKMADAFDRVARGELKRLIVNMPPRHTKSEFASYLLPAFVMGNKPKTKIIEATHTGELAVRFGRKVRDLMGLENYREIFPEVELKQDSKAAGRWDTNHGGEYFAVGVGGAMTGRGADLLVIDDPHSEQDALSELALDNAWEWYSSGPRQRLQPGGAIVVVMCMTGDTPVLMADGTEKLLQNIRPNDEVATFDKGRLSTSKVNNWRSSGVDSIYKIQTQSGKILRANERHPFLVMNEGVLEWTRLKHLKAGDLLVSLKDATDHLGQKQNPASAEPVGQKTAITVKTQMHRISHLAVTACGGAFNVAWRGAKAKLQAGGCALSTMAKNTYQRKRLKLQGSTGLNGAMESLLSSTIQWLKSATAFVMSAANPQTATTLAPIGMGSCALTTATTRGKLEDCYATTATLQSDMERRQMFLSELQRISDFTADPIASITPDGEEEVFDVEVDRTENFIANGVVSHNTRWGTKDLTARLLKAQTSHKADKWEVIEFPAILPSGGPLWPGFWKLEELLAVKASLSSQKWQAQWQQQPTNDEGAILKREWWQRWPSEDPPLVEYIIQSYDTAYSKKESADYSVITTWGVFVRDQDSGPNIILLDVKKGRWDFPELKRIAREEYKTWNPDNVLIEAKATGITLQQELRRVGIPVTMYSPGGRRAGQDKVSRANSIAPILESGMVWAPETEWADELIEECAAFPNGDHDDMVDSTTQALMRFRAGNFIALNTDEADDNAEVAADVEYY